MLKILKWSVFLFYILLLIYIVFLARRRSIIEWNPEYINIVPFRNLIRDFRNIENVGGYNYLSNLIGNIFLFVPLPYFLYQLFNVKNLKVNLILGFLLSLLIEILQLFLRIGIPDVDDIMLNTVGMLLGIVIVNIIFVKRII
jgi:glycopeptide antibiotics resistance protein